MGLQHVSILLCNAQRACSSYDSPFVDLDSICSLLDEQGFDKATAFILKRTPELDNLSWFILTVPAIGQGNKSSRNTYSITEIGCQY